MKVLCRREIGWGFDFGRRSLPRREGYRAMVGSVAVLFLSACMQTEGQAIPAINTTEKVTAHSRFSHFTDDLPHEKRMRQQTRKLLSLRCSRKKACQTPWCSAAAVHHAGALVGRSTTRRRCQRAVSRRAGCHGRSLIANSRELTTRCTGSSGSTAPGDARRIHLDGHRRFPVRWRRFFPIC